MRVAVLQMLVAVVFVAVELSADEFKVSPLTEDQTAAMESIRERDVLATVGFLASDEMAGRNTPSTELNIAAAYVASRFRAAGLEGLGPEGSFYQTTEIQQVMLPNDAATVSRGESSLNVKGLMFAPASAITVKADVVDGATPDNVSGKIAIMDDFVLPPQAVSNPGMTLTVWARRLSPVTRSGAVAVVVKVGDDSLLPELIRRVQGKPLSVPPSLIPGIPVVLVSADSELTGEISITAPARETVSSPVHNAIGVLRGRDPEFSEKAVMITAHLDHIGRLDTDRDGDAINNGADDNATGVTAVVTLADAFSQLQQKPRGSMIFMTFWGEEKGLLGSKYYADQPLWPLDNTIANINIEMIGRPEVDAESKAWGTGWNRSTLCDQLAAGAARAGVTVFHREDVSEMLYTRSDNYSLVQRGVIAHSFSAGSLHSDYHQPSDEVDKLNLPHMTHIIKGLFAGALPIADGELTPAKSEKAN
jgi:hypothetical protein